MMDSSFNQVLPKVINFNHDINGKVRGYNTVKNLNMNMTVNDHTNSGDKKNVSKNIKKINQKNEKL